MEYPAPAAQSSLFSAFAAVGGRCAVLSAEHLPVVEKQWLSSHAESNGTERCLSGIRGAFDFTLSQGEGKIRSIVVAAIPSPPLAVEIDWPDGAFTAYLPPVYGGRAAQMAQIHRISMNTLEPYGFSTYPVALPKKLLAAMSGLGRYGRNNILYIEGLGSCHRLTAFGTDAAFTGALIPAADWALPRCKTCGVCAVRCPSGAIDSGRFRIHPDRCITFYNESGGEFPAWLDPGWHSALAGCVHCQERCPENRGHWVPVVTVSLERDDVTAILAQAPVSHLEESLRQKLALLGLLQYYSFLPRNLRVLAEARNRK